MVNKKRTKALSGTDNKNIKTRYTMAITKKQLEKIGIHFDGSKIYPNKYWCNITDSHLTIYLSSYTLEDVVRNIYSEGVSVGIEEGKDLMRQEFKGLLKIE